MKKKKSKAKQSKNRSEGGERKKNISLVVRFLLFISFHLFFLPFAFCLFICLLFHAFLPFCIFVFLAFLLSYFFFFFLFRWKNDYRGTGAARPNVEFRLLPNADGLGMRMAIYALSKDIRRGDELLVSYGKVTRGWDDGSNDNIRCFFFSFPFFLRGSGPISAVRPENTQNKRRQRAKPPNFPTRLDRRRVL